MTTISRHWNGHTEDHPTIAGARLSTFSTGVRNAYDASVGLFIPYPSDLVDSRGNTIPANKGWLYDSLSYQGFAPAFADGFSHFVNRNTFDHDLYRANLEHGQKGTRPKLPETLDFEYRKRPLDAAHVEGIVSPEGETFRVRYPNAWGPGIHREILFGWQRFADEVVIDANTGADQSFRFQISSPASDWFNGRGPGGRRWDGTTTNEFHGGFELQHLGTGKLSFIRPDFVELKDGSRVPTTIRLVGNLAGARGLVKLVPASVQAQAVYPIRIGTVSSFFSGAGDGYIGQGDADWSIVRNSATGSAAIIGPTDPTMFAYASFGANYQIRRSFVPYDTSSLPDNSNISASTFKLFLTAVPENVDASSLVVVGPTTQANTTTLGVADYNKCGTLDNPTEVTARVALVALTVNVYNSFAITVLTVVSTTGFTKIGFRNSRDVNNLVPTGFNETQYSTSEFAGTSQDPILEVTYTTSAFAAADLTGGMQQMTGGMDG